MNFEGFRRKTADDIEKHGRTVIGVFPVKGSKDPINEAFIYSIGNAERGLPELLVVGSFEMGFVVNRLSEIMIERGGKFEDGELVSLGGEHSVCVVDAADSVKANYTVQATNWHGSEDYV